MGFISKLLGFCKTEKPQNPECWNYDNGTIVIDLNKAKELAIDGGAIRLEGKTLPERVLVVRENSDSYHAFQNRCTHMGRRLDPSVPATVRCCSVGQSTFDIDGKHVSGTAREDLTTYPVTWNKGTLNIAL